MVTILSTIFGLTLSVATPAVPVVAVDAWTPAPGDRLIVDTASNEGYLIHENGQYTQFPVLTGQRRVVRYIGRTYNAATPLRTWTVKSSHIKGDRVTFGPTWLFLRLYYKDEDTAYGIHGHKSFQQMLDEGERYRSMGCILVSEQVLEIIKRTYEGNGNTLEVATVSGIDLPEVQVAADPAWLGM